MSDRTLREVIMLATCATIGAVLGWLFFTIDEGIAPWRPVAWVTAWALCSILYLILRDYRAGRI